MTGWLLWSIVIGAYAFKALGTAFGSRITPGQAWSRAIRLLPLGMLCALITVQTLATGQSIHPDARLAGVAVGGALAWRRAHIIWVMIAAATVTSLVRLL